MMSHGTQPLHAHITISNIQSSDLGDLAARVQHLCLVHGRRHSCEPGE